MIIEDEALVAMMMEDLVTDLGHEVVGVAGRVDAALTLASDLDVDFAVLDLNLDGVRTDAVARVLKSRHIPFLFATGYGAAGAGAEWLNVPVVQKPFAATEFGIALAKAMHGAG